jgi:lipopolysaccharide biosynthesis glycosyltransferase
MDRTIWIGFDPREAAAFAVARESCRKYLTQPLAIHGLVLDDLIKAGLYTRPIEYKPSAADPPVMWDVVSDAPMSTQHANARFFVPRLAKTGWALFVDGDVMFRGNVRMLFDQLDPEKAVYCVQHRHEPEPGVKMDGQVQTRYGRKNWSSVIAFNCDHAANRALTLDVLNTTPGRDLHRLCWLDDNDIGELDQAWNVLVGHTDPEVSATIAHFTSGTPDMLGYENAPYADEWREVRDNWARGRSPWA